MFINPRIAIIDEILFKFLFFLNKLNESKIPTLGISFGSPYLPNYNYLDSYICAYGYGEVSLSAATDALFGRKPISGKLPINLNNKYKIGQGIEVKKNDKIFNNELSSIDLAKPLSILEEAIENEVFPGAQLFVSKGDKIIINKSIGKFSYDDFSKKVSNSSIYDVASLTKVLSITPVVMKLIQKKWIKNESER